MCKTLFIGFCIVAFACASLDYGFTQLVTLHQGKNHFTTEIPENATSPRIVLELDGEASVVIDYSFMQDTLDTKQVSKTARKIILMVHGDYKDTTLYITITNKEKREITGTLVVEDEPNLSSGARVGVSLAIAIINLIILNIFGKLIRRSYPNINTTEKYRITFLFSTGTLIGSFFWVCGAAWMIFGSAFYSVTTATAWMLFFGPLFLIIANLLFGFAVIEADKERLQVRRYLICCIPCSGTYDMKRLSVFYLATRNPKNKSCRIECKRVDGIIIPIEATFSAINIFERQTLVNKLNEFIPPENRTQSPKTQLDPLLALPPYVASGDQPPQYEVVVHQVPNLVTSKFLQDLVSVLSPEDQGSIMALYYSKPSIVQECVRDIKDLEVLRCTLLKLSK